MKKENLRLDRHLKPFGLRVVNAIGHGANINDVSSGRLVAKVHLQDGVDVERAIRLLRRRGYVDLPSIKQGA